MDYKKLMGYGDKKKVTKKQSKSKVNEVLQNIKEELNEWNDSTFENQPKRWSKSFGGTGLTEFERKGGKDTYKQIGTNKNDGYILHGKDVPLKEGPSYEYANYMKKIEKAENIQAKEVNNLVKLLTKKGLKKEATFLAGAYMKSMGEFDKYLKTLYGKLT